MNDEQWRDIPGYENGYQVSNWGRVRTAKDVRQTKAGRIFKGRITKKGYQQVKFRLGGAKPKSFYVHQLVMLAFVGERPEGMEVNHKNGNKIDNRLENLEYVTHWQNMEHWRTVLGYPTKGEDNYNAKLTDQQVREIRYLYHNGFLQKEVAKLFGVSEQTISAIITRRRWGHLL